MESLTMAWSELKWEMYLSLGLRSLREGERRM